MMVLAFLKPETMRTLLLTLLGVGYLGYHLLPVVRRWAMVRRGRSRSEVEGQRSEVKGRVDEDNHPCSTTDFGPQTLSRADPSSFSPPASSSLADLPPGAELFEKARAIPHAPIPSFRCDAEYLELLGQSAALDFPPALAKLGEYAMRREVWVEAYYWMSRAKRSGMGNLDHVLRAIRTNWSLEGFPDEPANVNSLFTEEAGSVGRALLNMDSGHDAAHAHEFLKENYPELLYESNSK